MGAFIGNFVRTSGLTALNNATGTYHGKRSNLTARRPVKCAENVAKAFIRETALTKSAPTRLMVIETDKITAFLKSCIDDKSLLLPDEEADRATVRDALAAIGRTIPHLRSSVIQSRLEPLNLESLFLTIAHAVSNRICTIPDKVKIATACGLEQHLLSDVSVSGALGVITKARAAIMRSKPFPVPMEWTAVFTCLVKLAGAIFSNDDNVGDDDSLSGHITGDKDLVKALKDAGSKTSLDEFSVSACYTW